MAKPTLVSRELDQGETLLRALDDKGLPIESAFWRYREESSGYRLVLATPLVDDAGIRGAYQAVLEVLNAIEPELSLIGAGDITLVSPTDPVARGLKKSLGGRAMGSGRRVTGTLVGDEYVEDAFVYRA